MRSLLRRHDGLLKHGAVRSARAAAGTEDCLALRKKVPLVLYGRRATELGKRSGARRPAYPHAGMIHVDVRLDDPV